MAKKFTYKNQTKTVQSLIGYGNVVPGGTIESDEPIYNPNFVLTNAGRMANVEAPADQPKPDETVKKGSKK